MENTKRIRLAGVLLVIVAMIAMLLPTTLMAAPPQTGELIIHKYLMDDASKATWPGTGEAADASHLPSATDAKPLGGVTFKVYSVTIDSDTENGQGVYPAPGAITITGGTPAAPTQITDSKGTTFSITSAPGSLSSTGIITVLNGAEDDATATTGDIAQGIYLVIEQDASALGVTAPSAPFVVAVPMAKADGTGWTNPVHVYPKNEKLTMTKTASKPSVTVGDAVAWTINAAVPSDLSDIVSYEVSDQLDNALTYVSVTEPIVALKADGISTINVPSSGSPVLYTITAGTASVPVKVTFNTDGIAWLKTNNIRSVKIVINTLVNNKIIDAAHHDVIDNTAKATFTNLDDVITDITSNKEEVHTGTVEVTKVDSITGAAVNGAVFKIASSSANAKAGDFLREDASGNILDVGAADYGTATDITLDTASGNTATYEGLADVISSNPGIYWLSETKAPAGYNILVNPVKVDFSSATTLNHWTVVVTVKDSHGFTLPLTGAAGVAVFTIVGIVLIGSAVALVANTRRKSRTAGSQTV
ncbi:MAG: SpaH/EbpB family LPXTG-anchored major pilin [Coriobacteriia bacterium]|nr:SpaH/EbpB family LPXTG-anchored major pilin [Coriobacteriia bacterium]